MHVQASQPIHVANLRATEFGGSRINSSNVDSAVELDDNRNGQPAPGRYGDFPIGEKPCRLERISTNGNHQAESTLDFDDTERAVCTGRLGGFPIGESPSRLERISTNGHRQRSPTLKRSTRPWDKPISGTNPPAAEPRAEHQSTPEIPTASMEPAAVAALPQRHSKSRTLYWTSDQASRERN